MSSLPSVLDGLDLRQRMLLWLLTREEGARVPLGNVVARYRALANDNVEDTGLMQVLIDLSRDDVIPYPILEMEDPGGGNGHSDPAEMLLKPSAFGERFLFPLLRESEHPTNAVPVPVPILLLNGYHNSLVKGLAEIPPHNLEELQAAVTLCFMELKYGRWDIDIPRLMGVCPGPDFPTGGVVWAEDLVNLYRNGEESVRLGGQVHIEQHGHYPVLVVTAPPASLSPDDLAEDISRRAGEGKLGNVHDIRLRRYGQEMRLHIILEQGEQTRPAVEGLKAGPLARTQSYVLAGRGTQGKIVGMIDLLDEYVSREEGEAAYHEEVEPPLDGKWQSHLVSHPFLDLDASWRRPRRTTVLPEKG